MAMARSTPAQKPRGWASRISKLTSIQNSAGARSRAMRLPDAKIKASPASGLLRRLRLSHAIPGLAGEQAERDQHHGADGDAAIGDVEHRVAPLAKIHVDEI